MSVNICGVEVGDKGRNRDKMYETDRVLAKVTSEYIELYIYINI